MGEVIVLKFLYRSRSQARTVPSRLALTAADDVGKNRTAVTGAVCSENVTKQKPLATVHSFTCAVSRRLHHRQLRSTRCSDSLQQALVL